MQVKFVLQFQSSSCQLEEVGITSELLEKWTDSRLSAHFLTSVNSAGPVAGLLIILLSREYAALKLAWGTRHQK